MKILVADDELIFQHTMKSLLSPYGQCDVARNGSEAFDFFKTEFLLGCPYDLICLDIMMPGMSGQNVLKSIREFEAEAGAENAAKIIMTTSLGDVATIYKAFNEECDGFLVKPINKERLIAILTETGLVSGINV